MESIESVPVVYKCQRCGRQSPIEAAFVTKKRSDGSLAQCLCFECASKRTANSTLLLYLLLPVFGLLILLVSPGSMLGRAYLLIFAGLLTTIPLILLHEISHALTARALGFRVFAIHLGLGKVMLSRRAFGIAWTIRLIPSSAVTLVSGPEMPRYRLRLFLIHLAGPAFHALLIGALLWLKSAFGYSDLLYYIFLWTNIFLLVFNLFPRKVQVAVGSAGTDGWSMLNAPRLTPEDLHKHFANFYILETVSAVERGDLQAAREFAEKGVSLYPENPNMQNTLGYVFVNSNEYHESRQIFLDVLSMDESQLPIATKAILMNNVAFANIMLDDPALLPEADSLSEQAYQILSWEPAIIGTRGGVLVALDQPEDGLDLLKQALRKSADRRGKAIDACLIAWGEWKRGNLKEYETYLALAHQLDPECYLVEHIRGKTRSTTPG